MSAQENEKETSDNYITADNSRLRINNEGALGKIVSRLLVPCVSMADSGAVYSCLATAGVSSAIDYAQLRVSASQGEFQYLFLTSYHVQKL